MKVLVIGSGGREHALCWRLAMDHEVLCSPGNPGIAEVAQLCDVAVSDLDGLQALASERGVDLVVVGPEAPLVAGLADRLRGAGIPVFGPGQKGAQLEGSKRFAKDFFRRHDIPSGDFRACTTVEEARVAIDELGGKVVVKADGLAAGKGVVVCDDGEQALAAARDMLENRRFGDASRELVIEERLFGRELSVMAITDGRRFHMLATAEDHKAVFDGDQGPNTGGMGAVSPAPWATDELLETVAETVFERTLAGLASDGIEFRGVLYAGLMVTDAGPKMLEYNVRFGDPETQAVLPRLRGDFGAVLMAAARGELSETPLEWSDETTACVVMASRGYPQQAETGKVITGLDAAGECTVFHAGTRRAGEAIVTSGGRVLAVVGRGADVDGARDVAYAGARAISFEGAHYRTDIGKRQS
jgi:phosphoribosylamine--glycine ligase